MTWWDADGPGPIPPRLVVGGSFTQIQGVSATGVAMWDPATHQWSALASGAGGVMTMATMPNASGGNDVVVGGTFTSAGGISANRVARWDGTSWHAMGDGFDDAPLSFAILPNGDLAACGTFMHTGAAAISKVAVWHDGTWTGLGGPFSSGADALLVVPDPDGTPRLVVGGYFNVIGSTTVHHIAWWDGSTWNPLGAGISSSVVALVKVPNASGGFDIIAASDSNALPENVYRYNWTSWTPLRGAGAAYGVIGPVYSLTVLQNGDLLAVGDFGPPGHGIARWNGTSWTGLALLGNYTFYSSLELPNHDLVVGGLIWTIENTPQRNLAVYGTPCRCAADLDNGSGTGAKDGAVTIEDLLYYIGLYETGTAAADLDDGSGNGIPDGAVTIEDLLYFLLHFSEGC